MGCFTLLEHFKLFGDVLSILASGTDLQMVENRALASTAAMLRNPLKKLASRFSDVGDVLIMRTCEQVCDACFEQRRNLGLQIKILTNLCSRIC